MWNLGLKPGFLPVNSGEIWASIHFEHDRLDAWFKTLANVANEGGGPKMMACHNGSLWVTVARET